MSTAAIGTIGTLGAGFAGGMGALGGMAKVLPFATGVTTAGSPVEVASSPASTKVDTFIFVRFKHIPTYAAKSNLVRSKPHQRQKCAAS